MKVGTAWFSFSMVVSRGLALAAARPLHTLNRRSVRRRLGRDNFKRKHPIEYNFGLNYFSFKKGPGLEIENRRMKITRLTRRVMVFPGGRQSTALARVCARKHVVATNRDVKMATNLFFSWESVLSTL